MKKIITKGLICLEDDFHFLYKIAKIEYEENEDGNYKYIFTPKYSVIDLLSSEIFQGIPGLDLSLRKEVYERKNIVPTFISERSPQNNREDLWKLLEQCNMTSNNSLEWLIRTDTRYSGDRLFVIKYEDNKTYNLNSMYELVNRSDNIIRKLLELIARGDSLLSKEVDINDSTRKIFYNLLYPIYISFIKGRKKQQLIGINNAKANHKYKGRKKKNIDSLLLKTLIEEYMNHKITAEKASKRLGVSRSTFIRRLK